MYETLPTKQEYGLWNGGNQRLYDSIRGLASMLFEINAANIEEATDVLQDLILAHIRANELADRHRREKAKKIA